MTYSSRRKEVDMKKVIMIIAVAAILVGCKGKEFEVGERVTLEVTETDKESCKGCFFDSKKFCEIWQLYPCSIKERSDHKNVIFKEVKE